MTYSVNSTNTPNTSITFYNTLSRQKEIFKPLSNDNTVKMYVCGMTVYDYCHIGHARVMVVFDTLYRFLSSQGYNVTYVRNITDVDDKILKRAAENNESIQSLTNRFIDAMNEDSIALNIIKPIHEPRATDYIAEMIVLIEKLLQNGLAYIGDNGDVMYSVRLFPNYGKLSGKKLDELEAGSRVQVNQSKQDPFDFVLWKKVDDDTSLETCWNSPWGKGRPGWHIECSAMSGSLLGEQFDIHGGGADLQFPHHENEIAQSEGVWHQCNHNHDNDHDENHKHHHDKKMVQYWLHNGFVRVDDEKMSKSLGNFFTIRDVLKDYPAEVIRFFILKAHYRSPLNYSDAHLQDAWQGLNRLYQTLKNVADGYGLKLLKDRQSDTQQFPTLTSWNHELIEQLKSLNNHNLHGDSDVLTQINTLINLTENFIKVLADDLNTAQAIAVLFEFGNVLNSLNNLNNSNNQSLDQVLKTSIELFIMMANTLGLLNNPDFLQGDDIDELEKAEIEGLIQLRSLAKKNKDFEGADAIRQELLAKGIVLEDSNQGTTWRQKID